MARVTVQALAAVLGGAQSIHTNSKDEALALPSPDQASWLNMVDALLPGSPFRTQQVIAYESGVANTADPVGGSFAVEALTERIEKDVLEYLERIESLGGMLAAIESGFVQREIQESASTYQRALEAEERIVVGVNRYRSAPEEDEAKIPTHTLDPQLESDKVERLRIVRHRRHAGVVDPALDNLRKAAQGDDNLMISIIDAVEAYASIGEISDVLRSVFGEYREAVTV